MGRAELAQAVNAYLWQSTGKRYSLDAHAIARYERGEVTWPSAHYRAGLRAVLNADSDAELGFRPTRRGGPTPDSAARASFVSPDFGDEVELGMDPAEFLARIQVETSAPARVGWPEVAHVRAMTRLVARSENLFGGGLSGEAASDQLRWAGRLLAASARDDVRHAMLEAVGNLGSVVAFSAFDIGNHTAAERCFRFALWCADQSGSWALRANTLAEMSRVAVYLGDVDGALSLIEFAQVRSDRVSATARAMMSALRARLLALSGRTADARAEVGRADDHFSGCDPSADPPWLCYYDEAEHQGSTGRALLPVARSTGQFDLAASRLTSAINLHDPNYPRSRTFSRTRLAGLMMVVGDPRQAVPIGQQAVTDAVAYRSHRIRRELTNLARVAERHARLAEVVELRQAIAALVASGP